MRSAAKMAKRQTVLGSHGITHQSAPMSWDKGLPVGNGFLGAMFWGDGNPLKLTLDCTDLWDERTNAENLNHSDYTYANLCRLISEKRFEEAQEIFGNRFRDPKVLTPTKISIGRVEVSLGQAIHYTARLDLESASIRGALTTKSGRHQFLCFAARERNLICLRIAKISAEAVLRLIPLAEACPVMAGLHHPAPIRQTRAGVEIMTQTIPEGPSYAVVWNQNGPDIFIAVELADTAEKAADKAFSTFTAARQDGIDLLFRQHVSKWKQFWSMSAVFLPEAELEFFWYYGIYLLASAARRGCLPPGLNGVWSVDDGERLAFGGEYANNINVQETFWPACASGHLELMDTWCDYMHAGLPSRQAYTRRFFGTDGTFWPCVLFGRHKFSVSGSNWYALNFGWSHSGWLGWMVWLRWRYSMDRDWLRSTGYPVVAEIFKFFRDNLVQETDGYLHVPLTSSQEYRGHDARENFCKDANSDLALIRRCCDWIIEMESALDLKNLTDAARNVRARLVPYALSDRKELCLWPGKVLDESHRHPSHLMAIHPAMDMTIDGDETTLKVIKASVQQYLSLGQYRWNAHTYAQMISFAAVLGASNWAYDCLRQLVEHGASPNGFLFDPSWRKTGHSQWSPHWWFYAYSMDANCGASAGISDMLLQGWNDIVRVFPAVPDCWRDIAFRDLRTEGAWKVSAIRMGGQTAWLSVTAGVKRELRLLNPFGDNSIQITGAKARRNGQFWEANLKQGQTIIFRLKGTPVTMVTAIRRIRRSVPSRLGLP